MSIKKESFLLGGNNNVRKKITESNYFSLVNKTILIFIAIITAFLITGIGLEVKAGIRSLSFLIVMFGISAVGFSIALSIYYKDQNSKTVGWVLSITSEIIYFITLLTSEVKTTFILSSLAEISENTMTNSEETVAISNSNLNKIEELRTLADNMKNIISDLNKLFN